MSPPSAIDLAKTAYAAYGEATDHLDYQGLPMPAWDELGDRIRVAWIAAAGTVALEVLSAATGVRSALMPDVGDVVLVPMDPKDNNGATVAPAVITRVWSEFTVNVRVLADSETPTSLRTSAGYRDSLDGIPGPAAVWTWPESAR